MKTLFTPLVALLTTVLSYGQGDNPVPVPRLDYANMKRAEVEQLVTTSGYITPIGWTIRVGDEIQLGKGSLPNRYFATIYQSPIGYFSQTSMDGYNKKYLISASAGKTIKVKDLIVYAYGGKKGMFNVIAKIGVGDLSNYWVEIDNAIEAGELIVPEPYAAKMKAGNSATQTVVVQQSVSTADEIKKLKDLLDSGAITKDEYETMKKKLLNQ